MQLYEDAMLEYLITQIITTNVAMHTYCEKVSIIILLVHKLDEYGLSKINFSIQ